MAVPNVPDLRRRAAMLERDIASLEPKTIAAGRAAGEYVADLHAASQGLYLGPLSFDELVEAIHGARVEAARLRGELAEKRSRLSALYDEIEGAEFAVLEAIGDPDNLAETIAAVDDLLAERPDNSSFLEGIRYQLQALSILRDRAGEDQAAGHAASLILSSLASQLAKVRSPGPATSQSNPGGDVSSSDEPAVIPASAEVVPTGFSCGGRPRFRVKRVPVLLNGLPGEAFMSVYLNQVLS